MEAGSHTIFLCALFIFSAEGAPKFTKTPQNSFLALEGDNITLEWRYTFVDEESFLSALLRKDGGKVVNKHFALSKPIIRRAYRGRLHANMTNDYTSITLLGVNRLDKGNYTLEVTSLPDEEGNISAVEISVLYIPGVTMIGGPQQFAIVGKVKKLLCEYDAVPPVSEVQWIKEGDVIARNSSLLVNESRLTVSYYNESQIQLLINQSTSHDAGNYTCLVINAVGNSSQMALVISQVEHEVTIDGDQEKYVAKGSNIRLTCRYKASPPVSKVQWIKDGTVIVRNTSMLINDSRVTIPSFNESQIQLSITAASLKEKGNYTCRVTNILNSIQDTTMIIIEDKPEIATHPHNITTREGQNVTLYCNATGNPSPTISWYKNGYPIRNGLRIILSPSHEQLTVRNMNRIDRGYYKCLATNRVGTDTSYASSINVLYRPEITNHPQHITEAERDNVTLTCNATGNPEPQFSWFKERDLVESNNRIYFSANNSLLTITDVNRNDSGGYLCVAHNEVGNETSIIVILDVKYEPEIITDPSADTVKEGKNRTFYCNATGNPLPAISWKKDGHSIGNNSRISYSAESSELRIIDVYRTDRGKYHCVASNSIGNASSDAATLVVEYKSEITTHPSNVTKTEGENVTLHCNATGYPFPTLSWTKDGSDISNNSRISFSAGKKQLAITKASRVDSGAYRCVANNSLGNDTSMAAVVDVQYVPEPPKDVKVMSRGSREVNISWIAGFNENSAIQNYTVEISEDRQTFRDAICPGTLLKNNCVIYSTRVSIKELSPWTTYYLRVFARNMIGSSHYSSVINVTTDEEVPSSAPPFNVTVLNSTAVQVSWQMLTEQDARGAIMGYYILYKKKREPEASWKNGTVDRAETTSLVLASLDEYTSYQFAIQAFNRKGISGRSEIVERMTDGGVVPDPPQNITVDTKGSRVINISWTTSFDGNSAIENYTVEISEHDQIFKDVACQGTLSSSACVVSSLSTTASLTGLFPWTTYNIRVFARNKIGRSNSSPILNVTTDEAEPSRGAENVSSSEVNHTTNRITWAELPKETANGVIKLYEVRLELKESCLRVDFTFYAMNTTKTSVLLTGFWMCAKYEVSVRGYTVAGPGPFGKAIVVQTKSLKLSQTWSKETPSPPSFSQIPSGEGITANITLPRFPGNAKFFQVIVIRYSLDYTGVVNSPESFTPKDLMTYEEAHKSLVPAAYVTFQFRGQDFDAFREFVVGDGENSSSKTRNRRSSDGEVFLNKPLQPNTNYRVFLRAFIEKMVYFSCNFVTIETRGEPAVKDLPERIIFQVGDVVVLTCEATGDPKPSVTWSKDGNTSIPGAQFRNNDHILVIQEVAPSDGGIYECRASNIFGQRRTATAVIIAVPPSIMKDVSPRSVLCVKETSCSLLCHATSDIPFNYSWTRNGQALDGHNIKVMNNSVVITPLDGQDFGDYVCHTTNSFGSTTYKITLSESREEENNVQSIFRANDIAWSCIVFVLLVLIGVLIWRLRRAQASNRPATAKKATIRDTVQSVFPLEQHASEPASYMELRSRPSEGQARVLPEYQSLQGSHVNAGYYNVVPEEGNKRGPNEEIYEEIELSDC